LINQLTNISLQHAVHFCLVLHRQHPQSHFTAVFKAFGEGHLIQFFNYQKYISGNILSYILRLAKEEFFVATMGDFSKSIRQSYGRVI
jgi:hypothetical protein